MTPQSRNSRSSAGLAASRPRLLHGALLLAVMLVVSVLPSAADLTGMGGGSESVGSLPSTMGPGPGAAKPTPRELPFQIVLVGDESELRALIADATCTVSPSVQPLEVPGLVRVTFSGAVELSLDRRALERSFASFSIELGPAFDGGAVGVVTNGSRSLRGIGGRSINLHLQQLSWSGLADKGVLLHAITPARARSRLAISATPERVLLVQNP